MKLHIDAIVNLINSSEVVALPTETVYGLAASLHDIEAIKKIFMLKGRPSSNPLIIHIANSQDIKTYAREVPSAFEELVQAFWPGPLTLILPVHMNLIPHVARAGLTTAGFRIPRHPLTLEVLKRVGPIVMPSANLSGRPSATTVEHVEHDFGPTFPVLDGDPCQEGLESTILYYRDHQWMIVRLGSLTPEDFKPILGYVPLVIMKEPGTQPLCPGQLFRHYAPQAELFLGNPLAMEQASFILGFKERDYPESKRILYLGSLQQPSEVAENLYAILRQLDLEQVPHAWVDMDFPREGLWLTIAERLQRAGVKE